MSDRLIELAREVAVELQHQPDWSDDALEVRNSFESLVDDALGELERS